MSTKIVLAAFVAVVFGPAQGQFTEHIIDDSTLTTPRGISAGDLDGDGDQDVVAITSRPLAQAQLVWYANDGSGSFGPALTIDIRQTGEQVEVADLEGDGDLDLLATWSFGSAVWAYYNDGNGAFTAGEEIGTIGTFTRWSFLASDLSGDGLADAVLSGDHPTIVLVQNDGSGGFLPEADITGNANDPISLRTFDADLDGDRDLLYVSAMLGDVVWQENLGGGTFGNYNYLANTTPGSLNSVHPADLDGDGDADILFRSVMNGLPAHTLAWAENDGGSLNQFHSVAPGSQSIHMLRSADIDADGDIDIIAGRMTDGTIEWYANDGTGNFSAPALITNTCDSLWWITTADMDGDGAEDVVASAMADGVISWFGYPGISTFVQHPTEDALSMTVAPNPFTHTCVIGVNGRPSSNCVFSLIDGRGRLLRTWRGNGSSSQVLDRGDLPSGLYLLRVEEAGRAFSTQHIAAE
jgi:hypothetical protein